MLEEWRGSKDSMGRTQEASFKFMMEGCKVLPPACLTWGVLWQCPRSYVSLAGCASSCREPCLFMAAKDTCTASGDTARLLASPQSWQRTSFPDQSPVMVIHEFRCPTLSTPNNLLLQYAERLPIGLESVIRHVDAATVKGFYRKWYRPERMAVVCVGDFADPDAVVATLQAALSTASAASSAPAPSLPKYARPGLLGAFLCALGTRPLPRDWDLGCSEWRRLGASAVGMCCGCHAL